MSERKRVMMIAIVIIVTCQYPTDKGYVLVENSSLGLLEAEHSLDEFQPASGLRAIIEARVTERLQSVRFKSRIQDHNSGHRKMNRSHLINLFELHSEIGHRGLLDLFDSDPVVNVRLVCSLGCLALRCV